MHYFTINTHDLTHIGFLIMLPDDGGTHDAPHGQFTFKLTAPQLQAASELTPWAENTELRWAIERDRVQLFDEHGTPIGSIHQQHLKIGKQSFILNDLTGVM